MIPFNHLGWMFKTFGSTVYPKSVRTDLCTFLQSVTPQSQILDIGAGTGMMCEFANTCRSDLVFTAVDPSRGMLKHVDNYIETYEASAEALPFDDNSFDVVLMGESLHHFRNIDESLTETVRVLKKEGKLFIYDFNLDTFMGKSICRGEKLLGEPGHFFVPEVLKSILEGYGFIVEVKRHGWRYTIHAQQR